MTLDIFLRVLDKERVLDALVELYPDQHRESYSEVWDEIMTIRPKLGETMIICVTHVYCQWNHKEEPDDYISVHGEDPEAEECKNTGRSGREITWSMALSPWSEWLGMEVEIQTDDPRCNTVEKVAAHILWEMTFYGYSQDEVGEENAKLQDIADEVEKWREEGTLDQHCLSWDEVKKELDLD